MHTKSDTFPFKKWSLIPFPLSVGWIYWLASNEENIVEVIVCYCQDYNLSLFLHVSVSPSSAEPALEKASRLSYKQPHGEGHMLRNWSCTTGSIPSECADSCSSADKQFLKAFKWLQSQLKTWLYPCDNRSQNYPAKLPLDPWLSETA